MINYHEETPDKPCDLGYYMGYKICQAYYEQASDKRQAVAARLTTKDFRVLLAQSGYEQKMSVP